MLVFAVVACLEGLTRGRVGGKSTRKEKAKENRRSKVHAGVNWRTEKSQQEDKQKYAQDGGRVST